jgi:hypothetical protein
MKPEKGKRGDERVDKKIKVLEKAQKPQVNNQTNDKEHPSPGRGTGLRHIIANEKVGK